MSNCKLTLSAILCVIASALVSAGSVIIFNPLQTDGKNIEGGLFNDIVSAELSCADGIKLVDREQLGKLLREKSLSPNGMLGAGEVSSIGTLLGADNFISGTVREKGDKYLIFVKSISVKTGVVKIKYINTAADLESAARKTVQCAVELLKETPHKSAAPVKEQLLCPEKKRPAVAICIPEIHIASQRIIDPAAENELIKIFLQQKFNVKQLPPQLTVGKGGLLDNIAGNRTTLLKAAKAAGADFLVYGEAISESSDSFGNYRTSRARVELKVISTASGNIIRADSAYAGAADTAEIISGKKAIQKAAAKLAAEMIKAVLTYDSEK